MDNKTNHTRCYNIIFLRMLIFLEIVETCMFVYTIITNNCFLFYFSIGLTGALILCCYSFGLMLINKIILQQYSKHYISCLTVLLFFVFVFSSIICYLYTIINCVDKSVLLTMKMVIVYFFILTLVNHIIKLCVNQKTIFKSKS